MADPPGGGRAKALRAEPVSSTVRFTTRSALPLTIRRRRCIRWPPTPGARLSSDSNDIALGITQAQQSIRSYYILGYYTTNNAEDGKVPPHLDQAE